MLAPEPAVSYNGGDACLIEEIGSVFTPTISSPDYEYADGSTIPFSRTFSILSGNATVNSAGAVTITGNGNVLIRMTETLSYPACGDQSATTCEAFVDVELVSLTAQISGDCDPFSVVNGSVNWSYQWYFEGSAISGATGSTFSPSSPDYGEYHVEITTPEGCTDASDTITGCCSPPVPLIGGN